MQLGSKSPYHMIDSIDKPDNDGPSQSPVKDHTWKVLSVALVLAFIAVFVGFWLLERHYESALAESYTQGDIFWNTIMARGVPLVGFAILAWLAIAGVRIVWQYARRLGLVNLGDHQATIKQLDKSGSFDRLADKVADAMIARANNSQYAGVKSVVDSHNSSSTSTTASTTLNTEMPEKYDDEVPMADLIRKK